MNTGAEAVENAVKIARAYTRPSGYHLRSKTPFTAARMMGLALTSKTHPYKAGFEPLPSATFIAFPSHTVTAVRTR